MDILKHSWVDILVTAVIAAAVFTGNEVAGWAVMVYTPFMVLLKIAAFVNRHSTSRLKPQDPGISQLIFHLLYAVNVALLVYGSLEVSASWWWVAACWALIWLLSAAAGTGRRARRTEG